METDGNTTDASPIFLLDYLSDSYGYGRTATDTKGSFQELKSEIGSRSLGLGVPDTLIARRIVHYCFGTMLALSGVAGTLGNVLVLYVFTRYRRLRGGGGPLILSLASGDLMVSVWHFMPAYSSFTETWSFGDLGCQIYAASVGLGGMASLITLSVIAVDRFSVIMGRPLPGLSGKKTCVCIWLFCHILVIPPFLGWSKYQEEGLGTSCSWDYTTRTWNNRSYYIFILFFGFVVPVTVIIVSYVGILRVVCQHSNTMNGVTRNGIIHNKKRPTKNDIRTAQVILKIIVCFLMSWTPYALVSLIGQFGDASSLTPLGTALPAMFAKASVIYNPIVYGLSHPHFRSAIQTLKAHHFPNRRPRGPHDRYHCHLAGYAGRRHHIHEGRVRFMDETQKNRRNHQRELSGTNSESGTTNFGQGMSMRTYSSRGSGTDVIINRKGWAIIRRYSPEIESEIITGRTCTAGIDGFGEMSGMDSAAQSEPDLVADDRAVKLPECISIHDGSAEKKQLIRTSFFRSENCLENLLKVDKLECNTFLPQQEEGYASATITCAKKVKVITHENAMEYETTLDCSVITADRMSIETKATENSSSGAKFPLQFCGAWNGSVFVEEVYPKAGERTSDHLKHSLSIGDFLSSSYRSPYFSTCKYSSRGLKTGGHHAYARNDVVQLKRSKCVKKIRRAPRACKYSPESSPLTSFRDRPYLLNLFGQDEVGRVSSSLKTNCLCSYCQVGGCCSTRVLSEDARALNESIGKDLPLNSCDADVTPPPDFRSTKANLRLQKCNWRDSISKADAYLMQETVGEGKCKRERCPCQTCGATKVNSMRVRARKDASLDSSCITSCSEDDSTIMAFQEDDDGDQQSLYDSVMTSPSNLSDLLAPVNYGGYGRSWDRNIGKEALLEAVHIYKNPCAYNESSYDSDTFYSCG